MKKKHDKHGERKEMSHEKEKKKHDKQIQNCTSLEWKFCFLDSWPLIQIQLTINHFHQGSPVQFPQNTGSILPCRIILSSIFQNFGSIWQNHIQIRKDNFDNS